MTWVKAIVALLTSLPKVFEYVDKAIGAFRRIRDARRKQALIDRKMKRKEAAKELQNAKTEKEAREAHRRLHRLG